MLKTESFTHKHLLLIIILCIILLPTLLFFYSKRLISIGQSRVVPAVNSQVLGQTGKAINNGVFEITVDLPTKANNISNYFEPDSRYQAYCIKTTIKNLSGSAKKFIPVSEIKVLSDTQQSYGIEAVPSCNGGVGGELQPGEVISGELGFIIDATQRLQKLDFSPIDKNLKSVIIIL